MSAGRALSGAHRMKLWDRHSPIDVARAFVDACNRRDAGAVAALLADDFTFQDSRGNRLEGRDELIEALAHVDAVAPDLRVEIDAAIRRGDTALLTGRSVTTNARLACDTQWRGRVRRGKLVEWEAYGAPSEDSIVGLLGSLQDVR